MEVRSRMSLLKWPSSVDLGESLRHLISSCKVDVWPKSGHMAKKVAVRPIMWMYVHTISSITRVNGRYRTFGCALKAFAVWHLRHHS